jgi:hypothetical protein
VRRWFLRGLQPVPLRLQQPGCKDFLSWGWRFPFFTAFTINVVALFARLRLVVTHEYERRMEEHELDPPRRELISAQGQHIVIGAFAALASYALFHLVTCSAVLDRAVLEHRIEDFMKVELLGAAFGAVAMPMSGLISDRSGAAASWARWRWPSASSASSRR